MGGDLLCSAADVEARLGGAFEPGSPERERAEKACHYVSAVLRARFPLIPAYPVPADVAVVATEVAVRYLGADPASGGYVSETMGAYSYRRSGSMGSTRLTDDEMLVMQRYAGSGPLRTVPLSNGAGSACRCGLGRDVECFAVGHAPHAPLTDRAPMP